MTVKDLAAETGHSNWADLAQIIFTPDRLGLGATEVNKAIALLEINAGARILDMPCGPGRHSVELAAHSFDVTGIDTTPEFIDAAKARASERGVDANFQVGDMQTFCEPESFDIVLNLFTSFGYFHDEAENRAVAANFFKNLKPGGELLIDVMGKETLARIFQPRDWRRTDDGTLILEERKLTDEWNWVDVNWTILDGKKQTNLTCGHWIYSAYELKRLLQDVGFIEISVFGNLDGADYDHQAERLVVTALKP